MFSLGWGNGPSQGPFVSGLLLSGQHSTEYDGTLETKISLTNGTPESLFSTRGGGLNGFLCAHTVNVMIGLASSELQAPR